MSTITRNLMRLIGIVAAVFAACLIAAGVADAQENPTDNATANAVSIVTGGGDPATKVAHLLPALQAIGDQAKTDPMSVVADFQAATQPLIAPVAPVAPTAPVVQAVEVPTPAVAPAPIVQQPEAIAPAPVAVTPVAVGTAVQNALDPVASGVISLVNGKHIPMPTQQEFDNTLPIDVQVTEAAELFSQTTVTADASKCGQAGFNQMVSCEASIVDANNGDAGIAPITVSNRYNPVTLHSVSPICGQFYNINFCEGIGGADHINLNRTSFDNLAENAPASRDDLMFVVLAHENGHEMDQNNGHVSGVDFLEWATTDKSHAAERVYPLEKSADTHAGQTYRAAIAAGDKSSESYDPIAATMKMMGGDAAHGTGQQRYDAFTGVDTISFMELIATAAA